MNSSLPEMINLTRQELNVITAALITAINGLGYTMYNFGGDHYLAPIPGHSSSQDAFATAMFGIWKVRSVIIDGKEVPVE